MTDIPLLLIAATVWIYWARVGSMVVRARRRSGDLAGLVPQQGWERLLWLFWVPMVAAWLTLPILGLTKTGGPFAVPDWARQVPIYAALRWLAAAGGLYALAMTLKCWARMGRDWRMDVRPDQRTTLIVDGLFQRVRHPIYAFSMLLASCTAVVVATVPMLIVAVLNIVLVNLKARNEERFLLRSHGTEYERYIEHTGRFFPRHRAS